MQFFRYNNLIAEAQDEFYKLKMTNSTLIQDRIYGEIMKFITRCSSYTSERKSNYLFATRFENDEQFAYNDGIYRLEIGVIFLKFIGDSMHIMWQTYHIMTSKTNKILWNGYCHYMEFPDAAIMSYINVNETRMELTESDMMNVESFKKEFSLESAAYKM